MVVKSATLKPAKGRSATSGCNSGGSHAACGRRGMSVRRPLRPNSARTKARVRELAAASARLE